MEDVEEGRGETVLESERTRARRSLPAFLRTATPELRQWTVFVRCVPCVGRLVDRWTGRLDDLSSAARLRAIQPRQRRCRWRAVRSRSSCQCVDE